MNYSWSVRERGPRAQEQHTLAKVITNSHRNMFRQEHIFGDLRVVICGLFSGHSSTFDSISGRKISLKCDVVVDPTCIVTVVFTMRDTRIS